MELLISHNTHAERPILGSVSVLKRVSNYTHQEVYPSDPHPACFHLESCFHERPPSLPSNTLSVHP